MLQQFYPVAPHSFKYELNKDMNFAAAHYIPHEDAGGCSRVHGHTYMVNITLVGNQLDHMGFLVNFQDIKKAVHGRYDHSLLNNHPEFADTEDNIKELPAPSTERVAEKIFKIIDHVLLERLERTGQEVYCLQVMVRETPTSYVVFKNTDLIPGGILYAGN